MPLIELSNVTIAFGRFPLLEEVTVQIEAGEHIGLVGRNGCGKSTFLKCLAGELTPDIGSFWKASGTVIGYLPQDIPEAGEEETVEDLVLAGNHADSGVEDWEAQVALQDWLDAWQVGGDERFLSLSAGLKRKVWLARAMLSRPDLLILDEPTNHLDIEAIAWLEKEIRNYPGAVAMVTHDRQFLQNVANRLFDLDRGRLTTWSCSYEEFLRRKDKLIEEEEAQLASLNKELKKEEAWLRQGVKARRTRNQGRLRALQSLRQKRREVRKRQGQASLTLETSGYSGEKVAELTNVSFAYEGKPVLKDFSFTLTRGDRIGIVGPNGAGKSTLVKLILGQLNPTGGTIQRGTQWEVLYFDQLRDTLEEEKSIFWNIGHGSDFVDHHGVKKHVRGYLQEFLFPPEQVMSPVKSLSGGEKNRLMLARLLLQSANFIIFDEPTNDLDVETIELLEECLYSFKGTLLIISHDRSFLDNIVTDLWVLEGDGEVQHVVGGYGDYLAEKAQREAREEEIAQANRRAKKTPSRENARPARPATFTPREQKELDELPQRVEACEKAQADFGQKLGSPELYRDNPQELIRLQGEWDRLEQEKEQLFQRWEELEAKQSQS